MNISDSGIIITGAGSGFGKEMSIKFSDSGAKIYAVDINETSLKNLKSLNDSINIFRCDVSNNDDVETLIENIFNIDKTVNILINNAGIMENAPLINILKRPDCRHPIALWQKVIGVNQNSVFYMTRSFAEKLIKYRIKGLVINISSISAKGNIGQTAYSASKAAVESMTKVWSKELALFGIRSVAIAPGFIDTEGTHNALEDKILNKWIEQTPLKRTGTITEVVNSVKFAIENDFLNGDVINLNGGLSI